MAMFIHQYGMEANEWPQQITMKVLEKEYHSVNEESRRRFKVFGHLPMHAVFQLVEADLSEPLFKKEVVDEFHHQLKARQQKRTERQRVARRLEKQMKERERKEYAFALASFPKASSFKLYYYHTINRSLQFVQML
jgi:hypothetical protein